MYARSTILMIFPASMDEAIAYMGEEVWPAMRDMDGCIGLSMMCDRESGKYIATSAWEDRQAMRASDQHVHPMREQMVDRFGAGVGEPEIREWEIAVLHREHATGEGACCRITWLRTDPSRADQLLDMYRTRIMPRIEQMHGFSSLSMLIDRDSGRAVGTAVFESRSALEQSRDQARMLREESTNAMDVDILDVAEMELVFAHLRVPETV
ncbi:antibiotic biosynthesis monooxygenase [Geodermatophilus sp. CPCC 206100]|uniref:antibiotic biosynthesis monooxygenase n=1 Tax=Geodermatophilus sp. CPCC 206100 TaxID=3020054 RepID=UPI003AFFE8E4